MMRASILALSIAACNASNPGAARPAGAGEEPPAASGSARGGYQTDAPAPAHTAEVEATTVASGLEHPWALEFLPDGRMLVTERPGRLRIVSSGGAISAPLQNVPKVHAEDQGGLLDIALARDFASSSRIYLSYAEPREGGAGTTVAAATLRTEGTPRLEDVKVIFRQLPTFDNGMHFGSRIVVANDNTLFVALGERFTEETRQLAQTLDNHLGKIVRIGSDGAAPADNPYVGREGARPEIWSIGNRNIQAAALHPETGRLWIVDHGPKGGDEVNIPEPGANYGWPVVSYGVNYDGTKVGTGKSSAPGVAEPLYYWVPSIAPSGMAFYTGEVFPEWRGDLFVGALAGKHLNRLDLEDGRVVGEEQLLTELDARIRDVKQGPDGALYLVTDADEGKIVRVSRAASG